MRGIRANDTVTLDEKGRITLPARLRASFEGSDSRRFVVHYFRGAVWLWTSEDFARYVESQVDGEKQLDPRSVARAHACLGTADGVELDSGGRIRLVEELRELAGLEKDVRIVYLPRHIELWSPERWRARVLAAEAEMDRYDGEVA
jgi:MraZ protein